MQIQLCISDPELSDAEKTAVALSLLYGNGVPPDIQTALDGLSWFLNCGAEPSGEDGAQEETVYSFEYDAGRIASAFRKVFGLDITRQRLHWFEFIPMLGDLNGTAFTGVIDIRTTKESEVDQKKRAEFLRMKKRFALSKEYAAEEDAAVSSFMEQWNRAE